MNPASGGQPEDMKAKLLMREVTNRQQLFRVVRRHGTLFHSPSWFWQVGCLLACLLLLLWEWPRVQHDGMSTSALAFFALLTVLLVVSGWIEGVHRRIDALVQLLDSRALLDK